jgi:dephospho-CoA kinase
MSVPKFLVIGNAGHGKDTAAEMLCQMYAGMRFVSSSMFAAERVVYPALKDKYGYTSPEQCYADRVNHRAEWYNLILEYNDNRQRLTREIVQEHDIYVGMRSKEEYEQSKELFDIILWVDRSKVLPLESKDSMTIEYNSFEHIFIDNNGTLDELRENLVNALANI